MNDIKKEARFGFGKNWSKFLLLLDQERITQAKNSLITMLGQNSLSGKRFLDIGSGSGLFSLAARQLGAEVFSFDYDHDSVFCTASLRDRYFPKDSSWKVEQGSVLDKNYLNSIGTFNIVYSWGVLHHTGSMWEAIENAADRVADRGQLFIALYNDQGSISKFWTVVKKTYCSSVIGRWFILITFFSYFISVWAIVDLLRLRNPVTRYTNYKSVRGMSRWIDLIDWLGGYPFEVASPGEVVDFIVKRGFLLAKIKTAGGRLGCNEFVFVKV